MANTQILSIDNFNGLNIKDKLVLTADSVAAITSIPVVNSQGVSADDFLIVGGLATDYSEQAQSAHTGFAPDRTHVVVTAPLGAAHKQFDPLWVLFGDKIKVYRAPNVDGSYPPDANYALLTTIPIDYDNAATQYTDPAGSSAYWYKITYFNSITSAETTLADSPITIRGGDYITYTTIAAIRNEAGLNNNEFITDSAIDMQRYRAQAVIDGALEGLYVVPFAAPVNPMISYLTEKLAAANLLSVDYGPMASGNSKDADKKMAEYKDLMTKIDDKVYVLTDTNGNNLAIAGAGGIKAWPNSTTDSTPVSEGGSQRNFRYGMRF